MGKNTDVIKLVRRLHIKLLTKEKAVKRRKTIAQKRRLAKKKRNGIKLKCETIRSQPDSGIMGWIYCRGTTALGLRTWSTTRNWEGMGQIVGISEWLNFDSYDRVWYWKKPKMDIIDEQNADWPMAWCCARSWQRYDVLDIDRSWTLHRSLHCSTYYRCRYGVKCN